MQRGLRNAQVVQALGNVEAEHPQAVGETLDILLVGGGLVKKRVEPEEELAGGQPIPGGLGVAGGDRRSRDDLLHAGVFEDGLVVAREHLDLDRVLQGLGQRRGRIAGRDLRLELLPGLVELLDAQVLVLLAVGRELRVGGEQPRQDRVLGVGRNGGDRRKGVEPLAVEGAGPDPLGKVAGRGDFEGLLARQHAGDGRQGRPERGRRDDEGEEEGTSDLGCTH
jgi:hypothetical protein